MQSIATCWRDMSEGSSDQYCVSSSVCPGAHEPNLPDFCAIYPERFSAENAVEYDPSLRENARRSESHPPIINEYYDGCVQRCLERHAGLAIVRGTVLRVIGKNQKGKICGFNQRGVNKGGPCIAVL